MNDDELNAKNSEVLKTSEFFFVCTVIYATDKFVFYFSSPNDEIARNRPNTNMPSFNPSPAVRAVSLSFFSARRLSNSAATSPANAPMRAPVSRVLLLFMVDSFYMSP